MKNEINKAIFRYGPSSENAVYLLLGLLWEYVPYNLTFDEFEVNPKMKKYDFDKWVDACGQEFKNGEWVNVTYEFKLISSELLDDIEKNPNYRPDWLICWEHDEEEAEIYAGNILCLLDIYQSMPQEKKEMIISSPFINIKDWGSRTEKEVIARFSDDIKPKIEYILKKWPYIREPKKVAYTTEPKKEELVLKKGNKSVAWLVNYKNGENIRISGSGEIIDIIQDKYQAQKCGKSTYNVSLTAINEDEIDELLSLISCL